jgi:hypothetical protein
MDGDQLPFHVWLFNRPVDFQSGYPKLSIEKQRDRTFLFSPAIANTTANEAPSSGLLFIVEWVGHL